MKLNVLGLDTEKSTVVATKLNELLAGFQVYYQNLRGIHWNIKGKQFFELHLKFEELYTDANQRVDEIAERILTLGGVPYHTFSDYVKHTNVKVGENVTQDEEAVQLIINSLSALLQIERELLDLTDEANDEGSNALVSELVSDQEKTIWMMQSWLGK